VLFFGALFIALGIISDGSYALIASHLGSWLRTSRLFAAVERYIAGGIFVTLGVTAAIAGGRPTKE
jgi:threonine/homoserine/homoserine lactone efflux protein